MAADTDNRDAIEKTVVHAEPLAEILQREGAPRVIDYLSLDTEGAETRILLNFDFERYRFRVMTIERPSPQLHTYLLAHDYILLNNDGLDGYYCHRSLLPPI